MSNQIKRTRYKKKSSALILITAISFLLPFIAVKPSFSQIDTNIDIGNIGNIDLSNIPGIGTAVAVPVQDYTNQINSAIQNAANPTQAAQNLAANVGIDFATASSVINSVSSGNLGQTAINQALSLATSGLGSTANSILSLAQSGAPTNLINNAFNQAVSGFSGTVDTYVSDALSALNLGDQLSLDAISNFANLDLGGLNVGNLQGLAGSFTGQLGGIQNLYSNISDALSNGLGGQVDALIGNLNLGNINGDVLNGALNILNVDPTGLGSQVMSLINGGLNLDASNLISSLGNLTGLGGVFSSDATQILTDALNGNINLDSALNIANQLASGIIPAGLGGSLSNVLSLAQGLNIDFSNPAAALSQLANIPQIGSLLNGLTAGLGVDGAIASASNILGMLGGQLGFDISSLSSLELGSVLQNIPGLSNVPLGQLTSLIDTNNILGMVGVDGIASNALGSLGLGFNGFSFGGSGGGGGGSDPCCVTPVIQAWFQTNMHLQQEWTLTRNWVENTFITQNVIPALMLMTEQLNTVAVQQLSMIGMMLDAKHQLETQRLLQELQAEAHKDYHPSEGMCTIGTNVRFMASAEEFAELGTAAVSTRTMQRQLLSGDVLSKTGPESDAKSRLHQFIDVYCDPNDNNGKLNLLCANQTRTGPERKNKDIDFTRTVETQLTLDLDVGTGSEAALTNDEEDIFALAANLYANEPLPRLEDAMLSNAEVVREGEDAVLLNLRSIAAKRSVAQNSFAAITGMRTSGMTAGDAGIMSPFIFATVEELGLSRDEATHMLGVKPSYFAQMEVLTKKLYQNPNFYTDLYDKPANIERKAAALQAIGLMQDRDIYKSLLRSEALLSVLLETKLIKEQDRIKSGLPSSGGE